MRPKKARSCTRRQRFLREVIAGLVIGGHVHLTRIARAVGRQGKWFVKAYRRRWAVEDATRGIKQQLAWLLARPGYKQQFHLEQFLVRSWRSIRRLIILTALAFYWLNLWGEARYETMRQAILNHPWRIPKEATYLFDWIATLFREILHPRPTGWFDTG